MWRGHPNQNQCQSCQNEKFLLFFLIKNLNLSVNLRVSFKGAILFASTWFHVKFWESDGISTGSSSYKSQRKLVAGASHFFLGHFQDSLICFDMGKTILQFWGFFKNINFAHFERVESAILCSILFRKAEILHWWNSRLKNDRILVFRSLNCNFTRFQRARSVWPSHSYLWGNLTFFWPIGPIFGMSDPKGCPDLDFEGFGGRWKFTINNFKKCEKSSI